MWFFGGKVVKTGQFGLVSLPLKFQELNIGCHILLLYTEY